MIQSMQSATSDTPTRGLSPESRDDVDGSSERLTGDMVHPRLIGRPLCKDAADIGN